MKFAVVSLRIVCTLCVFQSKMKPQDRQIIRVMSSLRQRKEFVYHANFARVKNHSYVFSIDYRNCPSSNEVHIDIRQLKRAVLCQLRSGSLDYILCIDRCSNTYV